MKDTQDALVANELTKRFFAGKPNEVVAIAGVSFAVPVGSCVLLEGSSGSGKTTLLSMLACLSRPTSGEYWCLGERVSRWSERFLTRFRQQHIGIVFQHFHLIPGLSVSENLSLPLLPLGQSLAQIRAATEAAAALAKISHRLDFQVNLLSGGELQRVAIARALIADPSLIFADEPTAHLDRENARNILSLFAEQKAAGKTLILTSHDPFVIEHPIIDQRLHLQDGQLV
ncbi:MAG: ABC transporter ATP-binding protein [Bernardetiaceae bacterium]